MEHVEERERERPMNSGGEQVKWRRERERTKRVEMGGETRKKRDGLGWLCLSLTQSETGVAWQRLRVEVHIGVGDLMSLTVIRV